MAFSLAAISFKSSETLLGILLLILMIAVVVILCSMPWIAWFRQELKFLNIEIERNSHNPREQARWKRRKKRLLLSLLPGFKYE